ncbi:hypothetical protein [Thermococcus sp. JCM 11816]|uniref:hypothetical protein n=1 Tax=Thermococcus sp. (strain JCM 11816 / KS-1) TaxID=1295125 RepID=UPI00346699DC
MGAYPEVEHVDIAGKVVQISNHPLVIRGGGDFIVNLRKRLTNVYAIVIIVILGGLLTFSGSSKERSRRRSKRRRFIRIQGKTLYGIVSVLIISGFLAVIIASWGGRWRLRIPQPWPEDRERDGICPGARLRRT